MQNCIQGVVTVLGRLLLSTIFLMSAVGNIIPNFSNVVKYMSAEGVPLTQMMLVGAVVFLIVGSLSIIVGFKARWGGGLLLVFLILATYFFHDFWTFEDAQEKQQQMIAFMKNLALMGTMLFIIANGSGSMSLDNKFISKSSEINSVVSNQSE